MTNNQVWYVHGANSTCTSFNYIRKFLPAHEAVNYEYGLKSNLDSLSDDLLSKLPRHPVDVISHSLGGVVASIAAQKDPSRFRRIVTISSPFGGSEAADYLKWLYPKIGLYANISTSNRNIMKCVEAGAAVETLSIITTSGNPTLIWQPNDGVVSVDSQNALDGNTKLELAHNHHDVLQADDTVEAIAAFLFEA